MDGGQLFRAISNAITTNNTTAATNFMDNNIDNNEGWMDSILALLMNCINGRCGQAVFNFILNWVREYHGEQVQQGILSKLVTEYLTRPYSIRTIYEYTGNKNVIINALRDVLTRLNPHVENLTRTKQMIEQLLNNGGESKVPAFTY